MRSLTDIAHLYHERRPAVRSARMSLLAPMLVSAATLAFVIAPAMLHLWGRTLPPEHEASRSVHVAAAPADVFALLADVRAIPRWRKTVRSVQTIAETPRVRFRERGAQGTLELEIEQSVAPSRLVLRTAPVRRMIFSGTWTFELDLDGDGTRVTLTERGTVHAPIARLFAAYALGHATHVERTLAALTAHFRKR
jgi:uncharacterized protein YndB with AHSA1/START domain